MFTVPAAVTPLAAFKDGVMTGYAGCNTFSGPYKIDGENGEAKGTVSLQFAGLQTIITGFEISRTITP